MSEEIKTEYPGGSKSRVNKAGENIKTGVATKEDYAVFESWRSAHRQVLNTFQAYFRIATKRNFQENFIIAQRHKRKSTIINKLSRHPKMMLSRMDDIAGCRLIFDDIASLNKFRSQMHNNHFKHTLRNTPDKYDYIAKPKGSGYRGIHDVYEYKTTSAATRGSNGLYIEIQYRTKIQHAWATAVEVVGHVFESQPKFEIGDIRYHEAMALAAEIMARVHEGLNGPFPEMPNDKLVEGFKKLDKELGLLKRLKGLNLANEIIKKNTSTILIFSKDNQLEVRTYRGHEAALNELFILERTYPDKDIVLVSAPHSDDIRYAYKNYFSDAREFAALVTDGIKQLSNIN